MAGRNEFGRTWWGRAWIDALEQRARLDPNRLPRGRTYARHDRVMSIAADPGEVTALVAGSRPTPYRVRLRVRTFTDEEWTRVIDAITAQAGHAAALLDGELLPEIVGDLDAVGVGLLPGPGELGPQCTCPDWADPCKHAAAVCYLVGLLLDRDPFELLHLRGRNREQVLAAVRARRGGASLDDDAEAGNGAFGARRPRRRRAPDAVIARRAYARVPATLDDLRGLDAPRSIAAPGVPPALPVDPPGASGVRTDELDALAAAAAERALALLDGDDDRVARTEVQDLARLAAARLGHRDLWSLAHRAGRQGPPVVALGAAWSAGGREALDVADGSRSEPPPDWAVAEASAALEGADLGAVTVRVQGGRVTAGAVQLRWAPSGRWYRFDKLNGRWQVSGPPAADPAELC